MLISQMQGKILLSPQLEFARGVVERGGVASGAHIKFLEHMAMIQKSKI